jgi:hypothetical protein
LYDRQNKELYTKKKTKKNPLLKEINKAPNEIESIIMTTTF